MVDKSVARKYKLEKSGLPNKNSEKTIEAVKTLCSKNQTITRKGKEYVRSEMRLFGSATILE